MQLSDAGILSRAPQTVIKKPTTSETMHYFIIAGEASGDLHGAALIKALKERDSKAEITFLGGDYMTAAAGHAPLIHNRDMAYMGFSEVLRNLKKIFRNIRITRRSVIEKRPDCLILIDYPSFNLKIAKTAFKAGIPVFYYISPKIWAWKEWRVKSIRRYVKRVFSILPFEKEFYKRHGVEIDYVGNPSVEEITKLISDMPSREEFLSNHKFRDRSIIALLPGSRIGEIKCNLPIMVEAARRFPQYRAVIAGAPGLDNEFYSQFSDLPVVEGSTFELLYHSRAAIVTSGTATLETAIIGTPQVAVYRSNGSKLAYKIMRKLIKVDYVTLPNLIAGREIIPELLLHECTVDTVSDRLAPLLTDTVPRHAQLEAYSAMRDKLGKSTAAETTADLITRFLQIH